MDMRLKKNKEYVRLQKRNRVLGLTAVWIFLVLAFLILIQSLNKPDKPLLDPHSTPNMSVGTNKPEVKNVVQAVEAKETPCDYDPITYLRCRGKQLGISDFQITKIIQVMKCESGLRPDAINKNSNGTFDIGIGQINDVHNKRINRQDRMDFKKNIDFIYKLYQEQGLTPWVCARKLGVK